MAKRYFKSTFNGITIFRASETREYLFGVFRASHGMYAFSARNGDAPAVEITKSEYEALMARKVERLKCQGRDPARYTSPQDSWVREEA